MKRIYGSEVEKTPWALSNFRHANPGKSRWLQVGITWNSFYQVIPTSDLGQLIFTIFSCLLRDKLLTKLLECDNNMLVLNVYV